MKLQTVVFLSYTIMYRSLFCHAQDIKAIVGTAFHTSGTININGNNYVLSEVRIVNNGKLP